MAEDIITNAIWLKHVYVYTYAYKCESDIICRILCDLIVEQDAFLAREYKDIWHNDATAYAYSWWYSTYRSWNCDPKQVLAHLILYHIIAQYIHTLDTTLVHLDVYIILWKKSLLILYSTWVHILLLFSSICFTIVQPNFLDNLINGSWR